MAGKVFGNASEVRSLAKITKDVHGCNFRKQ